MNSGKVCEIGTYDLTGAPLTIKNEAYAYITGVSDPWQNVVGGLVGLTGKDGASAADVVSITNSINSNNLVTTISKSDGSTVVSPSVIIPSGDGTAGISFKSNNQDGSTTTGFATTLELDQAFISEENTLKIPTINTYDNTHSFSYDDRVFISVDKQYPAVASGSITAKHAVIIIKSETENAPPLVKTVDGTGYITGVSVSIGTDGELVEVATSGTYPTVGAFLEEPTTQITGDYFYLDIDGSLTWTVTDRPIGVLLDNNEIFLDCDLANASLFSGGGDIPTDPVFNSVTTPTLKNPTNINIDVGDQSFSFSPNSLNLGDKDITVVRGVYLSKGNTIEEIDGNLVIKESESHRVSFGSDKIYYGNDGTSYTGMNGSSMELYTPSAITIMASNFTCGINGFGMDFDSKRISNYGTAQNDTDVPSFGQVKTYVDDHVPTMPTNPSFESITLSTGGSVITDDGNWAKIYAKGLTFYNTDRGNVLQFGVNSNSVFCGGLRVEDVGDALYDTDAPSWSQVKTKITEDIKVVDDSIKIRLDAAESKIETLEATVASNVEWIGYLKNSLTALDEVVKSLKSQSDLSFSQFTLYSPEANTLRADYDTHGGFSYTQTIVLDGNSPVPVPPEPPLGNEVPVYFGWDVRPSGEITAERVLDYANDDDKTANLYITADNILTSDYEHSRTGANGNYKYMYIAYPKDFVSPNPMKVQYSGFIATWLNSELVINGNTYIMLVTEYPNEGDAFSLKLIQ
jgi:hypothetical protein